MSELKHPNLDPTDDFWRLHLIIKSTMKHRFPHYVTANGPWFVKFTGWDPAMTMKRLLGERDAAFIELDLFPKAISQRIVSFLDHKTAMVRAGRIALKSDQRRVANVIERASRLYPVQWNTGFDVIENQSYIDLLREL